MNLRRLAAGLGAALGLVGAATVPASAQSVSPADAPVAWVAYAETVSKAVSEWLEEDGEASVASRGHIGAARDADGAEPVILRIWIAKDGRVERVEGPASVQAEAAAALREALVGRTLPTSPPPDMLQPLRIALEPGGSSPA